MLFFLVKFNIFFYALPFLFLPIFFKILLNLMKSFGNNNIVLLSEYFSDSIFFGKIKSIYGGAFTVAQYYDLTVSPWYTYVSDKDLLEDHNSILRLQNILMQVYFVKRELEKFSIPVLLITSALYFIAGIVRLSIIYGL